MTRGTDFYPDQLHPNFPKRTRGALSPIRTPSRRSTRHLQTPHPDDRHILSGYVVVRIVDQSKQILLRHSDSLPQPTFRRLQSERTGMMASHLQRSLTTARRVMMALPPPGGIMTSQKVSPPLKREAKLLTLYIKTFTQGGR